LLLVGVAVELALMFRMGVAVELVGLEQIAQYRFLAHLLIQYQ
tara:strand:- start:402 stop:530 length:129 start_codon:yes stop_codon:yes gene_type:complete